MLVILYIIHFCFFFLKGANNSDAEHLLTIKDYFSLLNLNT